MPPSSGWLRECSTSFSRLRTLKATCGELVIPDIQSRSDPSECFLLCPYNVKQRNERMTAVVSGFHCSLRKLGCILLPYGCVCIYICIYFFSITKSLPLLCLCSLVPSLTNLPLQAKALRFFMPDKRSTTMSGTQCECPAVVKTSNSLWMTT